MTILASRRTLKWSETVNRCKDQKVEVKYRRVTIRSNRSFKIIWGRYVILMTHMATQTPEPEPKQDRVPIYSCDISKMRSPLLPYRNNTWYQEITSLIVDGCRNASSLPQLIANSPSRTSLPIWYLKCRVCLANLVK